DQLRYSVDFTNSQAFRGSEIQLNAEMLEAASLLMDPVAQLVEVIMKFTWNAYADSNPRLASRQSPSCQIGFITDSLGDGENPLPGGFAHPFAAEQSAADSPNRDIRHPCDLSNSVFPHL